MTRKWVEMSGPEVARLAGKTDVAIVPAGSIEMHGPHLPTGTDAFIAEKVSVRAAELEPAIVLPTLYYTGAGSMKCYPGTISTPTRVFTDLAHVICREAARNAFRRIVFFVAHGGCGMTSLLQEELLERRTGGEEIDYTVFCSFIATVIGPENAAGFDGHGGAMETSWAMAARPELVHPSRVRRKGKLLPQKIPGLSYAAPWERQVPYGHKGDPRKADAKLGVEVIEKAAGALADQIRQVKRYRPERDA